MFAARSNKRRGGQRGQPQKDEERENVTCQHNSDRRCYKEAIQEVILAFLRLAVLKIEQDSKCCQGINKKGGGQAEGAEKEINAKGRRPIADNHTPGMNQEIGGEQDGVDNTCQAGDKRNQLSEIF
ncbi:hypothetical protein ES703_70557 [subsurface metagenome]